MELKDFKQRNIAPGYIFFDGEKKPENGWQAFKKVVRRTLKGELFVGLWIVLREMIRFDIHTIQYPAEKFEMSPRYRAIHLSRLLYKSDTVKVIIEFGY
jgi:NADH-quinone oxidoreductase subunit I